MSDFPNNPKYPPRLPWVIVRDPEKDLPTKAQHEADPRMYLAVTDSGRISAGEPEFYPNGKLASLWTPIGSTHLPAESIVMWLAIDVPDEIMARLEAAPKAKRSMLYRTMKGLKTS